jgi:hypothetical protein
MPYQEPLPGKGDKPEGRDQMVGREITPEEDLDAEARREHVEGKNPGPVEKVKAKAEELLDKVSGPDVPPTLGDKDKRA